MITGAGEVYRLEERAVTGIFDGEESSLVLKFKVSDLGNPQIAAMHNNRLYFLPTFKDETSALELFNTYVVKLSEREYELIKINEGAAQAVKKD